MRSIFFLSSRCRLSPLLPAVLLAVCLPACGAPPAVPLQGGAADEIARGIDSGTQRMDHDRFDRFLKRHVRQDGAAFDYATASSDLEELTQYLQEVAGAPLARLPREELLALLINAYNACTIGTILETFTSERPRAVESIRDLPDVFDREACTVGGFRLSLNNIEHNLIRPLFKDPRIHFAVNCASVGCPPLLPEAFTGPALETQLEAAARRTLASPKYIRLEKGRLYVSKLLDWYGEDFVNPDFHGANRTLLGYLRKYVASDVADWIEKAGDEADYSFLDYDWSLNSARNSRATS